MISAAPAIWPTPIGCSLKPARPIEAGQAEMVEDEQHHERRRDDGPHEQAQA